jgi:hypothetical protein
MDDARKQTYRNQAEHVIKGLKKRNMTGVYFDRPEDAVEAVCDMIPDGVLVGLGGSETILQTGLVEALRKKTSSFWTATRMA